jgi:hypothetical protein
MSILDTIKGMLPQKGVDPAMPEVEWPHWWSHPHIGQWVMHNNQIAKVLGWDAGGILSTEVHEQVDNKFTGRTYLSQVPIRQARMATSHEIPAEFRQEARTPDKWNTADPNHIW